MPTKRVPLARQQGVAITPRAIELYETMKRCRCSCKPERDDDDYSECRGCVRWWTAQCELRRELRLKPWEFPALLPPSKQADTDGTMRRLREPDERMLMLEERLKLASRARLVSSRAAAEVELPTST